MWWRAALPTAAFAILPAGGLVLWFVWLALRHSTTARAQETGDCESAQVINRFTGTGNQGTDPFETTGPFQVSYDLTAADSANLDEPSLTIDVYDNQSGSIVADASQEGEGTGKVIVDVPPGTYTLSLINGEYTTTVEQCGAGNSPSTKPNPESPESTSPDNDGLMNAGGPSGGRCRSCRRGDARVSTRKGETAPATEYAGTRGSRGVAVGGPACGVVQDSCRYPLRHGAFAGRRMRVVNRQAAKGTG